MSERPNRAITIGRRQSEIARLEKLSQSTGLSLSQIIRSAIAAYEIKESAVIMESWNGSRLEVGDSDHLSFGFGNVEIDYSTKSEVFTGIVVEGLSA